LELSRTCTGCSGRRKGQTGTASGNSPNNGAGVGRHWRWGRPIRTKATNGGSGCRCRTRRIGPAPWGGV